jgi:phosphohistidine swiveling domain-containing protein
MEFTVMPIKAEIDFKQFSELIDGYDESRNSAILLEKNENSDLVARSKPITAEFFEKVFEKSGPYLSLYSELGFMTLPENVKYVQFINGQMYFIKNLEYRYLNNVGPENSIALQNGKCIIKKRLTLSNIFLSLSIPFDSLKQIKRRVELGFMANEFIQKFEDFKKRTLEYYDYNKDQNSIIDPLKTAAESLKLAVESLTFSNIALLCYNLKIRLKSTDSISICEAEQLYKHLEQDETGLIKDRFGFYSLNPYDITSPRFREDTKDLVKYGFPMPPSNYCLKWRENSKYLCARYLDISRIALLKLGKIVGIGEMIFYLTISELEKLDAYKIKELAAFRKNTFDRYEEPVLPSKLILFRGRFYQQLEESSSDEKRAIQGNSVSSQRIVFGPAININSFEDYDKFRSGSIIISKTLSPNLSILFNNALGVISENGGALSHAALIAREFDFPCLVQTEGASKISDGEIIELNGKTGIIRILDEQSYIRNRNNVDNRNYLDNKSYTDTINNIRSRNTIRKLEGVNILPKFEDSNKNFLWLDGSSLEAYGVGAKAANLSLLSKHFKVPPAFCVTNNEFKKILALPGTVQLNKQLINLHSEDLESIKKYSQKIMESIISYNFSSEFITELKDNVKKLGNGPLAARSSSALEDSSYASFAGQFDSYLNISDFDEIMSSIKKCWASFFNTRAIVYRLQNNIVEADPRMSVIIQQMIMPEFSGVVFTRAAKERNIMQIEAVEGAGENLVSGKTTPNSYTIDRDSISILKKAEKFQFDAVMIRNIAGLGLKIEDVFNKPQDIEWSVDKDRNLWILQSRPITAYI